MQHFVDIKIDTKPKLFSIAKIENSNVSSIYYSGQQPSRGSIYSCRYLSVSSTSNNINYERLAASLAPNSIISLCVCVCLLPISSGDSTLSNGRADCIYGPPVPVMVADNQFRAPSSDKEPRSPQVKLFCR